MDVELIYVLKPVMADCPDSGTQHMLNNPHRGFLWNYLVVSSCCWMIQLH